MGKIKFGMSMQWRNYLPIKRNEVVTHVKTLMTWPIQFSSVQFSHSVVSNSFRPHESQLARPPCPSPAPGVYSNSHPSSRWCHPAISSSVIPFSSCPQSLPASRSFLMSQLFTWGGQSTGVSLGQVKEAENKRLLFHIIPFLLNFQNRQVIYTETRLIVA